MRLPFRVSPKEPRVLAVWKQLNLYLADGWYEVPGERPREYRRARPGTGVLQIQMLPPRTEVRGSDEEIDDALTDALADSLDALELGEPLSCDTGPCGYGRYVTALFTPPRRGRVRVWFLGAAGEPLVFATFIKQGVNDWEEESADAQAMIESAEMREVEPRF